MSLFCTSQAKCVLIARKRFALWESGRTHAVNFHVCVAYVAVLGRLLTAAVHAMMIKACSTYSERHPHVDILLEPPAG